jgi:hypothetical protein
MKETAVTYGRLIKITATHICQEAAGREGGKAPTTQRRNGEDAL